MVEPVLESLGGPGVAPLAKGQDAGGVVARPVEQLEDAAGAALLAATVRHGLFGCGKGAQQEDQEQRGAFVGLGGDRAKLAADGWESLCAFLPEEEQGVSSPPGSSRQEQPRGCFAVD